MPQVSKGKVHIVYQKKHVPIEIVCDMFEHFALRATLFLSTLPLDKLRELLETIAAEERCKQHAWRLQSQIAKSYALDRRATTICRRCHRDRCRASIGWRTVSFFESTSPRLYSSLPLLFFDTTILYHSLTVFFFTFIYPSAILSPFKSTVLSLCYPFILLLFICWGPGGVIIVTHETSRTIRGASGVTLTENDSHDWSSSHMKRHVHRTEQQVSPPNIVPATKNDPCLVWSVTYIARRNRCRVKQQVSPSNVEKYCACTKNDSHDWSWSQMKRHLHRAEQQVWFSNLTKCCACREKWLSWLILVSYETSFTSRGATSVILQPHQVLCHKKRDWTAPDSALHQTVLHLPRQVTLELHH